MQAGELHSPLVHAVWVYKSKFLKLICTLNSIICTVSGLHHDEVTRPTSFCSCRVDPPMFLRPKIIYEYAAVAVAAFALLFLPASLFPGWETCCCLWGDVAADSFATVIAGDSEFESDLGTAPAATLLSLRSLVTFVYSVGRIRLAIRQRLRGLYMYSGTHLKWHT